MEQRIKTATKKGTGRSTPTDMEKFVDAPGRKELVAQVRKKIDELGIEYLYLQFVSVTGRIMGKGIPADHWESIAKKGFQDLLEAFARLEPAVHGRPLVLLIAGDGPERERLADAPRRAGAVQSARGAGGENEPTPVFALGGVPDRQ